MSVWAILASGPSMNQETADAVRGRCRVVAVSDTYRLAPWADIIASADSRWWRMHQAAADLPGRRVSQAMSFEKIPYGVERTPHVSGENSGLFGCRMAIQAGAKTLLLFGFDMGGSHFFGAHPEPLKNTKPERFEVFKRQFAGFRPRGVAIYNCTPGSALKCYPFSTLEESIASTVAIA